MSQEERAMERILGDEGLMDELKDDEANVMIDWAQGIIAQMSAAGYDDDTFDAKFKQVRRAMKRLNKLIGQGTAESDPTDAQEKLAQIAESMTEAGYPVDAAQLQGLITTIRAVSKVEALQTVLGLLRGGTASAEGADENTDTHAAPPPDDDPLLPAID